MQAAPQAKGYLQFTVYSVGNLSTWLEEENYYGFDWRIVRLLSKNRRHAKLHCSYDSPEKSKALLSLLKED